MGEEPAAMFLVELSLRSPRLFWLPLFFRAGDLSSSRLPRDVSLQGMFSELKKCNFNLWLLWHFT